MSSALKIPLASVIGNGFPIRCNPSYAIRFNGLYNSDFLIMPLRGFIDEHDHTLIARGNNRIKKWKPAGSSQGMPYMYALLQDGLTLPLDNIAFINGKIYYSEYANGSGSWSLLGEEG